MNVHRFVPSSKPSQFVTKSTSILPAESISIPDILPGSLQTLEGMLVATLFVRALVDLLKSIRQ